MGNWAGKTEMVFLLNWFWLFCTFYIYKYIGASLLNKSFLLRFIAKEDANMYFSVIVY